jgi:hypothetical protein
MTPDEIKAIKQRQIAAMHESGALTGGQRKWTLSIPVQETDSDLVIGNALNDIVRLTTEVESQRNTLAAFLGAMQGVFDAAHYINDRDDEYELRKRLKRIEELAQRFEGVNTTVPME